MLLLDFLAAAHGYVKDAAIVQQVGGLGQATVLCRHAGLVGRPPRACTLTLTYKAGSEPARLALQAVPSCSLIAQSGRPGLRCAAGRQWQGGEPRAALPAGRGAAGIGCVLLLLESHIRLHCKLLALPAG